MRDGDGHRGAYADEVAKGEVHDNEGHGEVDGGECCLAYELSDEDAVHERVYG